MCVSVCLCVCVSVCLCVCVSVCLCGLMLFRCFTVEYGEDADKELGMHYDHSLITINVCINATFEGGELQFFGDKR